MKRILLAFGVLGCVAGVLAAEIVISGNKICLSGKCIKDGMKLWGPYGAKLVK